MKIVSIIARYLLGLLFVVFGLNGFLNFIHQPPPANPLALQFLVAVSASHFAAFFFAMQVIGGLLLLSGFFVPLALTVLAAELYNILAFHLTSCAGEHCSGTGSICALGPGLSAVPQKLQRHSCRKACGAGIVCFVAGRPSAPSLRNIFGLDTALLRITEPEFRNGLFTWTFREPRRRVRPWRRGRTGRWVRVQDICDTPQRSRVAEPASASGDLS